MSASYPTKVFLAMRSGNLCAFPDCRKELTADGDESDPAVVGEAAHIYGEHPGTDKKPPSARYRADMEDEERNHYDNLIYLCPSCHTKIDKQEEDYPAKMLFDLKENHESWVRSQLDQGMSEITFAELEIAAKAIASGAHASPSDLAVIPPDAKIRKNGLTEKSRSYISMGLSQSSEVERFITNMTHLDGEYPERLKSGFQSEYDDLRQDLSGDSLFMGMLAFAQKGSNNFKQQAASLAILSHLFHLCDVFEK